MHPAHTHGMAELLYAELGVLHVFLYYVDHLGCKLLAVVGYLYVVVAVIYVTAEFVAHGLPGAYRMCYCALEDFQ